VERVQRHGINNFLNDRWIINLQIWFLGIKKSWEKKNPYQHFPGKKIYEIYK
jgi:outer membrane protein W